MTKHGLSWIQGSAPSALRAPARLAFNALLRLLGRTVRGRRAIFSSFAALNRWGSAESRSGEGSTLDQTRRIREVLPKVLEAFGIRSLVDAPCGDGNWIRTVNQGLDRYVGVDIVPQLIDDLLKLARENECFICRDLVTDELPRADAVLCRDALVHLSFSQALSALRNIERSGARFLIATTFPGRVNKDIATGGWRPLDLCAPPFELGPPMVLIDEECTESGGRYSDKSLGVWWIGASQPPAVPREAFDD